MHQFGQELCPLIDLTNGRSWSLLNNFSSMITFFEIGILYDKIQVEFKKEVFMPLHRC